MLLEPPQALPDRAWSVLPIEHFAPACCHLRQVLVMIEVDAIVGSQF